MKRSEILAELIGHVTKASTDWGHDPSPLLDHIEESLCLEYAEALISEGWADGTENKGE
jgi:hypothetical protein